MPITVILGAQWGDEGKGKITDLLAAEADLVARFGGGDNAGHTVTVGSERFALHLIPSGILYPRVTCLLGAGMVVNPQKAAGRDGRPGSPGRGRLARAAQARRAGAPDHALPPCPRRRVEAARGGSALGTTKRGIGPAYTDKAARSGIRAQEMLHPADGFARRVRERVAAKNLVLEQVYGQPPLDAEPGSQGVSGVCRAAGAAHHRRLGRDCRRAALAQAHPGRRSAGHTAGHRPRLLPLRHQLAPDHRRGA